MDYDNIISHIGGWGRYQRRIFTLLCIPTVFAAIHTMAGVFLAAEPDYRCLLPHERPQNATYQLSPNITNLVYPWDNVSKNWSRCERYDVDLTDQFDNLERNISLLTYTEKCDAFVYDKTTYKLTTTTEFNLVCDNAWLNPAANSLYMVGQMLGATIFGALSDRYGRRPIFLISLIINLVGGFLVAASPEIISYIIFRMIVGASAHGLFLTSYVNAIEIAGPKMRLTVGFGMFLFFTTGFILTAGFAYFITNWRIMQIAITIPNLLCLFYWRFVPESARWLITMGRLEEAKHLLFKISSENGVELSEDILDGMLSNDRARKPDLKKSTIFDLLKYPNLRRKSLLLFFNWFVINTTFYGLSWNTSSLDGNKYLNFIISGLVEIPAHVTVFLLLHKCGRKIVLFCCLLLAGTSLLLTSIVPTDMPWMVTLFTMIGKSGITGSFTTAYIFTAEQYPTVIRNVGVGSCSTSARIGGIIAPIIIHYSNIWIPLPFVLFGCASLVAGLSVFLLPETWNQNLPEFIKDGEEFGALAVECYINEI